MEDAVRPTAERCYATFEQGYRSWYSLLLRAREESSLPKDCFQVDRAFQRQPTFPRSLKLKQIHQTLCASGTSNWETDDSRGTCRIPGFKQHLDVPVSVKTATHLTLSPCAALSANYSRWLDHKEDHLSILILAWAYILSARWAEVMPGATVQYTASQATWVNGESVDESIAVDVGNVQDDAARWWAAVLAPMPGWQAFLTCEDTQFLCPWSVKVQDAPAFVLSSRNAGCPSSNTTAPASSTDALRFLLDYCMLHGIADQAHAALSAALFLPFLSYKKGVVLPKPKAHARMAEHLTNSERNHIRLDWMKETRHLDKLLTLSCNIRGLHSLLSSIFYEPSIPCNLAGPWLQSAFAILDTLDGNPVLLAHVLTARVPDISFLWLGAIIMGIHKEIFRNCRLGMIPIDLHAAAWSGTIQSFIQEPALTVTFSAGDTCISRADECRLLFLSRTEHQSRVPICPWTPFGTTPIDDTDIEVRLHTQCKGKHVLTYAGWKWNCMNGEVAEQRCADSMAMRGHHQLPPVSHISVPYEGLDLEDETVSENATRSIFGWLRFGGYPRGERDICNHPWMNIDDSDYEEECIEEHNSQDSHPDRSLAAVEAWIMSSD
ncbi:predicted protein [Aspergillus terreus NIH2624]|uniref:Uncharacterized protein n=1 Tax=Aspergillus terreus (strain NIH 2624 / FGSC A1156) TaxID=341663 RepID=Q0CWA2_ASPTN|nr:uncharacterized protein ATEG_02032 [Aspergillus terreus NIH2624]EAU36994.1 predicted protein [Aspergillus terreus NIH2624]